MGRLRRSSQMSSKIELRICIETEITDKAKMTSEPYERRNKYGQLTKPNLDPSTLV